MVERAKQPSIVETLAIWQKEAPLCKCDRSERVIYLCTSLDCHKPGHQFYCQICLIEEKHNRPIVVIKKTVDEMLGKLTADKEMYDAICHNAA